MTTPDADAQNRIYELQCRVKELEGMLMPCAEMPRKWGLTKKQHAVLAAICARAPRIMSISVIHDIVYGADPDAPYPNIINVTLCYLRKKLVGTGVEIINIRGAGYYVSKEHADIVFASDDPK